MKSNITREEAYELLHKYNKEAFHIQHALTVEGVLCWYAKELGYTEEEEYWGITGLLHDIDFELYPEEHCKKAPELLKEGGVGDDMIYSICCHGYGICCDLNGVVYVTNYNDGTVSKIAGATVTKTIAVGKGPLSIAYNKDNELYVTNMLDHSVSKIVNDIEVTKINTSPFNNPCSFGDFIGGNAYYTHIYVPPATGDGSPITEADLDPLLQAKINQIVSLPLNANQVNHEVHGSSTQNVEEALEKLLVRKRQLYFVVGTADLVPGPAPMTFPLTFEAENGVTANNIIVRLGTASSKAISFDVEREVKNTPVVGNDPSTGDPIYGPTTISWVTVQTVNIAPGEIEAKVDITDTHKYEVGEAIRINFTTITDEAENLTAVITFDETV